MVKHDILVILAPSPYLIDIYGRSFEDVQRLERALPPQFEKDSFDSQVAHVLDSVTDVAQASLTLSFGLNFLQSAGLNTLLGMVETMQIILMPPLFNVFMPALPNSIVTFLLEIAHFDIIEMGEYYDMLFEMPPTEPIAESLDRVGFGDDYFIHNLGALSLIIFLFMVFSFVMYTLSRRTYCGRRSKYIYCFRRVNMYAVKQFPETLYGGPI